MSCGRSVLCLAAGLCFVLRQACILSCGRPVLCLAAGLYFVLRQACTLSCGRPVFCLAAGLYFVLRQACALSCRRPVFCLAIFFLHSYHPHRLERQRHLLITTQFGPFDDVLTEFDCINTVTCVCDIKIPRTTKRISSTKIFLESLRFCTDGNLL